MLAPPLRKLTLSSLQPRSPIAHDAVRQTPLIEGVSFLPSIKAETAIELMISERKASDILLRSR